LSPHVASYSLKLAFAYQRFAVVGNKPNHPCNDVGGDGRDMLEHANTYLGGILPLDEIELGAFDAFSDGSAKTLARFRHWVHESGFWISPDAIQGLFLGGTEHDLSRNVITQVPGKLLKNLILRSL
jgi:hypothetical protein